MAVMESGKFMWCGNWKLQVFLYYGGARVQLSVPGPCTSIQFLQVLTEFWMMLECKGWQVQYTKRTDTEEEMSLADTLLGAFSDSEDGFDDENGTYTNGGLTFTERHDIQELLTITDVESIANIKQYCPILDKLDALAVRIDNAKIGNLDVTKEEEQKLLLDTNKLIAELYTHFNTLNTFIKLAYNSTWSDLANIIKNPLYYVQVVDIVQFDISTFREHLSNEKFTFLPKDQILSLTMSANFVLKSGTSNPPSEHTQSLILEACGILSDINTIQQKFREFITERAGTIAPNITALVGPSVCAQLIASVGLKTLCSTPACNLPSVGKSANNTLGYVHHCDLVKEVSADFRKQAVRQVCSKVILAARIDYSNPNSTNNSLGVQWRDEIRSRLEKQMLPPENVQIKPLPKPTDPKSKRRGGRKFKKMRDRMKMSEVEKAQNKMAFGEQELSRTDAFGEEIGLGMLGKNGVRGVEAVRGVHVTKSAKEQVNTFTGRIQKEQSGSRGNTAEKESALAKLL